MKAQIIAALLFLILGIVFVCGKGTFLIAGYNTLPEEKKARYDARKILRDMSRMMFSCVGCRSWSARGSESRPTPGLMRSVSSFRRRSAGSRSSASARKRLRTRPSRR